MREVGHAAASNGASIKSSRLAVPTAAGALSLKPLGPRSARAVLWTCPVQVRRSALGNYCLGNYYLLANGLVFFVFSHLFTCARDPRLSGAWPVLELGDAARGSVASWSFSSLPRRSRRPA